MRCAAEEKNMKTIRINAGNKENGYEVRIGAGLLNQAGTMIREVLKAQRLAVFTDSTVDRLYADRVTQQLEAAGFQVCRYVFPAGEASKNFSTVEGFIDFMAENHLTRKDAVVALGGGVAGDMGGFAAAIYLRGISFVQIPTTLLAAVDSSVGGKTGIDIGAGKNLVGAFWQPELVLCDTEVFGSLTSDQILDGTAEILKTGAILDRDLFEKAAENDIMSMAEEIVERCVALKGQVVAADEKESGLRKILNFGHTMGHAIEKYYQYRMSHGKAVAMGMLMITRAAQTRGLTEQGTCERLRSVIVSKGFAPDCDAPLEELCRLASSDKKTSGNSISLVYLPKLGEAGTYDVALEKLIGFMQ